MGDFTEADDVGGDWGDDMLAMEFGLGRGSGARGVEVGLEELIERGLGPMCAASFDVNGCA